MAAESSGESASPESPKKAPGRPFAKGKSGNPGGRAAWRDELVGQLKDAAPDALDRLLLLSRGQAAGGKRPGVKEQLRAIELILSHTLGKPRERVELSGPEGGPVQVQAGIDVNLDLLSTGELRKMRDKLLAGASWEEAWGASGRAAVPALGPPNDGEGE